MNAQARNWGGIKLPLAAAVLGVAAFGTFLFFDRAPAAASAADDTAETAAPAAAPAQGFEAAPSVTAVRVEPVEMIRAITVNGAVHAWQEVVIGSEVGGYRVAEVLVDVGDSVKKGQTLVRLSTALLEAEVATRRAALEQSAAELQNAEAALRRAESLSSSDLLSAADLDRATADALAGRARVAAAQADLKSAQLRLDLAGIEAPDDGVVTARSVTVGEVAQVGSEMLRLLRRNRIEWRGEVPEAWLAELEPGQAVDVTTADGAKLPGTVRVVAPTVANANGTGLVYVDLESDPDVRPGMFARGDIEIGRGEGLTVPLESIVSADGYSYVFVLRDDRSVERRRIEAGEVRGRSIEVLSGLRAGERVVEKGAGFLKDGDRVNVVAAGAR